MMLAQLARGRLRSYPTTLFSNLEDGLFQDPSDLNATKVAWRKNEIHWSEDFSNSYWTKSAGLVPVADAEQGMWLLDDVTSGDNVTVSRSYSVLNDSASKTISVMLRKTAGAVSSYPAIRVTYTGGTSVDSRMVINTTTGAVTTNSGVTAFVEDAGTNWRLKFTVANNSLGNTSLTVYLFPALNNNGGSAGVPSTLGSAIFGKIQIEVGSTASAYQKITDFNFDFLAAFPKHTDFQDAAGTTSVTALGQPVGLMLDKRLGLVLGVEKFSDGNMTFTAPSARISTGVYRVFSSDGSFSNVALSGLTIGKFYEASFTIDSVSVVGGGIVVDWPFSPHFTTPGVKRVRMYATSTTFSIKRASTACDYQISNISVRELPGNHATQSTAASRPTLEARVNLLTKSEVLSDASWAKTRTTVTAGAIAGPLGALADKVSEDTSTDTHYIAQAFSAAPNTAFTASIYVKAAGRTRATWYMTDSATGPTEATINLANGTVTSTGYGAWTERSASITDVGDGWFRVTVSGVKGAGTSISSILLFIDSTGGSYNYTGDGVSGMYVTAAQLEYGTTPTTYQRVNTATDYVDVGAPRYDAFDKADDHKIVAAGGAGTTGILLAVGVLLPSAGTARTVWSDRGTNTGYRLSIDATNKVEFSAGTGAGYTTLTSAAALTAGQPHIILAWHDGTNLNLSINNVAETPVAQGTIAAGTTSFTIGKDNGAATGYWGDRMYQLVYRKNDTSTASQRANLYSYLLSKIRGL